MPAGIPHRASMRRTKIVCTIGPSSNSALNIAELLKAGLDVARINFSHGAHNEHARHIRTLRRVARELNLPIAIMQDLPGPKERTGKVKGGRVWLKDGDDFLITTRPILGDSQQVSVDLPDLPKHVKLGDTIFLGDGIIKMEITALSAIDIKCKVLTVCILYLTNGFHATIHVFVEFYLAKRRAGITQLRR